MGIFRTRKRKAAVVAASAIVALVGGLVAYAYWTTSGSGTGTVSTVNAAPLTITGTASNLTIGGTQTLTVTFHNPNAYPVALQAGEAFVMGTPSCAWIVTPSPVPSPLPPTPAASWFSMSPTTITTAMLGGANQVEIAAHTGGIPGVDGTYTATAGTVSVTMNDLATVNQDACQSATLTFPLTLTSTTGF